MHNKQQNTQSLKTNWR